MVLIFGCQQNIFLLHAQKRSDESQLLSCENITDFLELVFAFINLKKNAVFFPFFKRWNTVCKNYQIHSVIH